MPRKDKVVKAWAIQRKEDSDISNKIFETRDEAKESMAALPNCYFTIVRIEIRFPLTRKKKKGYE